VKTHKARFIIRGLRGSSDFDFESNLTGINYELDDKIDTIFLMASPRMLYVSSSMVREIAMNRGPVGRFVPACVDEALKRKYGAPSGRTKTMKQPRDLPGE
jgi:pantetheine-phosphate adenylyltransferase